MNKPNVFDIAMQMEKDGIKFYNECAEKAKTEFSRKLFVALIKDEERHLEFIKQLKEGLPIDKKSTKTNFREKIVTIFTAGNAREKLDDAVKATEQDCLRIAADMELRGITFYSDYINQTKNAEEKRVFNILLEEEKHHYQAIFNTKLYYDNPGDWFMVDEGWHFDGGGVGA
jgi:rubrerythrin